MAFDLATEAKRALVRRIVYVVFALMLGALGVGRAHAATVPTGTCGSVPGVGAAAYCSQAEALAACEVARNNHIAIGYTGVVCTFQAKGSQYNNTGAPERYFCARPDRSAPCNPDYFYWKAPDCSTKQPITAASFSGVPASGIICQSECEYHGTGVCVELNRDGQTWTTCGSWTPTGQTCTTQVGEQGSPPPDTDGDGSSDGNDTSPNNPGQGGGGPNGPSNEDEGGKGGNGGGTGPGGGQGNGAGEGSGNGNTAGGGQDCATPPSVTGDAALAMIAYQAWATRCEVTGLRADVGGGDGLGNGDGDGNGDGQGDGDSTVDIPPGDEADLTPDEGDESSVHIASIGANLLDTSGFLGGGACPSFGAVTFAQFGTYELQADWFCDWLPIFRGLIILMATFTALRILLGEV